MPDEEAQAASAGELDREVLSALGTRFPVRELRERVTVIEERIIVLREIDKGTPETMGIMGEAIEDLASGLGAYGIVIDLSEASGNTTPEYRRYIPEYFNGLKARSKGRLKLI